MTRSITQLGLALGLTLLGPQVASAAEPSFGVAGLVFQQAPVDTSEGELVFAPVGDRSVKAVWYDGGSLVLAASRGAINVLGREGEPTREDVDIDTIIDVDGTRASGSTAVFAAAKGRLLRWHAGDVDAEQVPLLEGDELVAVAIDARGNIYAIGRTHALYQRTNLRWKVFEYPTQMRPLGAAASPGGQVFLVGRDGLLVRFDDGTWDRLLTPGLSPETTRATWYDCWYSTASQTLWVRAGRDRLLEVDLSESTRSGRDVGEPREAEPELLVEPIGEGLAIEPATAQAETPGLQSITVPVREHPIPLGPPQPSEPLADFTGLGGLARADGDSVVVAAGGQVWLWERERFRLLAHEVGLVHDLAVDAGTNKVWLATQSGLRRLSLTPANNHHRASELSQQDVKLLDRVTKRDIWRRYQAEQPKIFWMPTLRIDNGVSFSLGATPLTGYSVEFAAGAMLAPIDPYQDRGPTLWLWPELAYRFEAHPSRGLHMFDAGLGIGYGNHLVAAFYRPRFVVGGIDIRGKVFGFRHGLALELLWGVVGIEFSHQFVDSNGGRLDDLRLGFGINLAPLIWLAILWATIPTNEK